MLGLFLALALFPADALHQAPPANVPSIVLAEEAAPAPAAHTEALRGDLMDKLMDKFHAMNDARQGIFQDDITPMIASYFPPGQPFAETQKIIRDQKLGELMKFQGMQDPDGGSMYVTKFKLMSGMFSEVYVVLHLDFQGQSEADMVVKKAAAYLRGSNM